MADTNKEAVERTWVEYTECATAKGSSGDIDIYDIGGMDDAAHEIYQIARALAAERDALKAELDQTKAMLDLREAQLEAVAEMYPPKAGSLRRAMEARREKRAEKAKGGEG